MLRNWKTIRVFISSTFQDMHAERDYLVRFVFPRLREQLLPYRIHLIDVDLRWGITSEQDASEVCCEIINECRPRFLCILGGRYGWVPPGKNLSITADEVHFGVLDLPSKNRTFAYFYFRDDSATSAMVEINPGEFREPQSSNSFNKLTELKQAIITEGLNPFTYSAQWDNETRRLTDLTKFGNRVYGDLLSGIKSDPELQNRFLTNLAAPLDEFTDENAAMEVFVEERSERFVLGSREKVVKELLNYTSTNGNGYTCLTGLPGSGKSALLAYLSRHSILNHQSPNLLISHFVGASPGSTNMRRTLRRFCHELKVACPEITNEIPEDSEELRVTFLGLIKQACIHRHVVILIDAINQFDLTSHSLGLRWLPDALPANVHIILSSLEGPVLDELRNLYHPHEIELKPLTISDGEAIIEQFHKRYHKGLKSEQITALLSKKDAGVPLYLLVALEELRTLSVSRRVTDSKDQDQAVLDLIGGLPPTCFELFMWILNRLQNDDGFRDEKGQLVGHELVPHFASLLATSRFGLSQHELNTLLCPSDPQGNVAALLQLLRPYLMRRGETIDFYHDQFRTAAKETWLNSDVQCRAAHLHLAAYFHQAADPTGKQLWEQNARLLGELPFHLAHAAQETELCDLFSQLAFLATRIATGQVYEQIADFSLLGSPLFSTLVLWRDFLQKHSQRLAQHPSMLIALINHEGFSEAQMQIQNVSWNQPWLKTSLEEMPTIDADNMPEVMQVQVMGKLEFPWARVSVIAPQRGIAFCFEKLGLIHVFDLNTMRQTNAALSIQRERPLVMVCSPDAVSMVIFFESGKAALFRSVFGHDNLPTSLEFVTEFNFQLPESRDPVVVWNKDSFWYQSTASTLASISVKNPLPSEESLPEGQIGELSALVFCEETRLIALHQSLDTLLLTSHAPSLRRQATRVATACACRDNEVASAFTDGSVVVFELGNKLTTKAEVHAGIMRGTMGWDGSRLLWMDENNGFMTWDPKDSSPLPVEDNQEVFPDHLQILPRQWFSRLDTTVLLSTTHSIIQFQVLKGGGVVDFRLEEVLGGPVWHAVQRRGKRQYLLEKQPFRGVLLGSDVMGSLYCALDGEGHFFAVSGYGPGSVLDLSTLESKPLQNSPPGINMANGDENSGCWFTDRAGNIYYANEEGRFSLIEKIGLKDIHGSYVENCADYLVWIGYSSKFFPDTGVEPARTFIFFKKSQGNPPMLKRVGEEFRHPREGLCITVCYDQVTDKLVTLWLKTMDGMDSYYLRVSPVKEFIRWQFQEINVNGVGIYRFVQADLSPNGQYLGIVNLHGELSCLSVADGRVVATLAGSAPFTSVSPGANGSDFWLVEARTRIYKCTLVEGTT